MAGDSANNLSQGLWNKLLDPSVKPRRVLSLTEALSSAVYVFVIGFWGNSIPKELVLMGGVCWYATVPGLRLLIRERVIRPESGLHLPPRVPAPRGIKAWLRRIHRGWFLVIILYIVASGVGFWFWSDREFLNDPPIVTILRPQAAQLAPFHQTMIKIWAEDPEGGNLDYEWVANDGEIQPYAGDTTLAIYKAPGTFGQQQITVIVTDNKGKRAERRVIIDVRP